MKIAVIGDISVDSYVYGKIREHNPDANKPLLVVEKEIKKLGCGGNCATNINSLGGEAIFYGINGDVELFRKEKIDFELFSDGDIIVKTRFIADDYLLRVDYGESNLRDISEEIKREIIEKLEKDLPDAILLSDYNKRVFRGDLSLRIIELAKSRNIPVIVDPKPVNIEKFKGADIICPNLKEGREITGLEDEQEIAKKIAEEYNCKVVLTLGDRGLLAFDREFKKINSVDGFVKDSIGAGDSLKAGIALAIASGESFFRAVEIGNIIAGIAVENEGTYAVKKSDLESKDVTIPW